MATLYNINMPDSNSSPVMSVMLVSLASLPTSENWVSKVGVQGSGFGFQGVWFNM